MAVSSTKVPPKPRKKPTAASVRKPTATKTKPEASISPAPAKPKRPLRWLTRGNTKMGKKLIYIWSVPAVSTCPGSTDVCRSLCYATQGHYRFGSLRQRYQANHAFSLTSGFVPEVSDEILRSGAKVVRIHGAGDFYSNEYVAKWTAIVRAHPGVTFYAYTRSWTLPDMVPAIEELSREPNFHMWYSLDMETGVPTKKPKGVRYAYMVVADGEENGIPKGMDLIFRVKEGESKKWMGGALVCPYEQKVERQVKMTCETCKICFTAAVKRKAPSRMSPAVRKAFAARQARHAAVYALLTTM